MRQAIKSDGSDGTAALATFLSENDEFLTQELYEFIKPGIGGALGAFAGPVLQWGDNVLDFGGSELFDTWVNLLQPVAVGDLLFAFLYNGDGGTSPAVTDTAGNAWTLIFSGPECTVWYAVAAAALPVTSLTGWAGAIEASDVVKFATGANGANSEEYVVHVSGAYTGFASNAATFSSATSFSLTAGSTTITLTTSTGFAGSMVLIQLSPGLCLGFCTFPANFPPNIGTLVAQTGGVADGNASRVFLAGQSSTQLVQGSTPLGNFADSSSPLTYAGEVYAPANIKNDGFKSKIGLDVDSLQLSWIFRGDEPMVTDPDTGATILTMLQAFRYGLWAGVWVKWRRIYMPTFGDCETLSAVSMFRGRIADIQIDRLTAKITVNSVTEMFNRQIPQQLIEANNRSGQIGPGLPPDLDPDPSHWTTFECVAGEGGTVQKIVASQIAPTADQVYAPGTFDLGYLLFQASPLQFFVAQVQHYDVEGGYNVFYLFKPLYVDPHLYDLTFVAFVPVPKDQSISGVGGVDLPPFLYVPLPEQAV